MCICSAVEGRGAELHAALCEGAATQTAHMASLPDCYCKRVICHAPVLPVRQKSDVLSLSCRGFAQGALGRSGGDEMLRFMHEDLSGCSRLVSTERSARIQACSNVCFWSVPSPGCGTSLCWCSCVIPAPTTPAPTTSHYLTLSTSAPSSLIGMSWLLSRTLLSRHSWLQSKELPVTFKVLAA